MPKYFIEIPEVHKALVEIESTGNLDRDTILRLAMEKFEEADSDEIEYSHTLEPDEWVIRDDDGNFIK